MNYDSVQAILNVEDTYMMTRLYDDHMDEGSIKIENINWFIFNNEICNKIYINANSYIGFNSDTKHLCVNQRDGAVGTIFKEEGTLNNFFKFLRIRWEGYSHYSKLFYQYYLQYDVILWDTGDISLHMIKIPSSYNNGTYALITNESTYNYTVSNSSLDVTFKKNEFGYEVSSNIIDLKILPVRYLISSNNTYYTVINNLLGELTDINELTADTFLKYGILEIPSYNLLSTLLNPKLLYWSQGIPLEEGLTISGKPKEPQIIEYVFNSLSSSLGIEKIEVISSSDVLFSVSFDEGISWKYYNGVSWKNSNSGNEGMTRDILNTLSKEKWDEIFMATSLKIRCCLQQPDSYIDKKIYLKLLS